MKLFAETTINKQMISGLFKLNDGCLDMYAY